MSFMIEEWSQSYPCWQELMQVIAEEKQTGGVTPKIESFTESGYPYIREQVTPGNSLT